MLLRLQVQGFKNLRDVDIRFGPLTCFVGPNGVGKSNLFDAIQFLRYLADDEIQKAAEAIRQPAEGGFSALDLVSNRDPNTSMRFVADMLVPLATEDDFGQTVRASASLLTYRVGFRFSTDEQRLVLIQEELRHQKVGDAGKHLRFPHSRAFRESVTYSRRTGGPFLSSDEENGQIRVQLHGDGGSRGRPVPAGPSPRTILGGTGTKEYPTIVAARREMASWHSVHLEPSSLRTPDRYGESAPVDEHGRHIAATLRRLARDRVAVEGNGLDLERAMTQICSEIGNQLARLVDGVKAVRVRDDEARQHHVVEVLFQHGAQWMPPRALSDGTLRYLALAAMQMDARASRVLCIEEPENGIEPTRIPALLGLLRSYAVDPRDPVTAEDNPLRQVILNSHSPEVVKQLDAADILFVESVAGDRGREARVLPIGGYDDIWRADEGQDCASKAMLDQWLHGAPRGQLRLA